MKNSFVYDSTFLIWGPMPGIVRVERAGPRDTLKVKEGDHAGLLPHDEPVLQLDGVPLMPLASKVSEAIPRALQPWYCDDAGVAGKAMPNAKCLDCHAKFLTYIHMA